MKVLGVEKSEGIWSFLRDNGGYQTKYGCAREQERGWHTELRQAQQTEHSSKSRNEAIGSFHSRWETEDNRGGAGKPLTPNQWQKVWVLMPSR